MKVRTLIDEIRFINTHIKENKGVFTIDVKKLNSILDYIKELEEENERLKAQLELEEDNRHFLNNKIDKAIEYIVTNREPVDERDGEVLFWLSDEFNEEDLLKILKGDE